MAADAQSAIDQRNRVFWDELCGSHAAQLLGITEINRESVAKFDAWYMDYYPYLGRYLEQLPVEGRTVLEIGLGYGTVGQILAARAGSYHGVDLAAGPVAMMRDRLRWLDRPDDTAVVQASALELPWGNASFDVVVSIGCLHHTGDLRAAIDEVHRVLIPGGRALVMLYNAHSFRQLAQVPRQRWRALREGRDSGERVRAMYDVNTAGAAAPHTDYVSRSDVRQLFGAFTEVSIDVQNFDEFHRYFARRRWAIRRDWLLGNIGRVLGLDLYIRALR
jgi:SAM-dependent methyltransferase